MATSSPETLLLVDGYNIIGSWTSLKKRQERDGLESARIELVETLINYSAHQGYNTQVVFDAHYQRTPGNEEQFTPSVSAYYTAFAQTADTYIEKLCANFSRKSSKAFSRLIVATSDQAQRLTILGYGAEWMSAQRLANDVDSVARQMKKSHRSRKVPQSRFLVNSLDAKSQEILAQWRYGIY